MASTPTSSPARKKTRGGGSEAGENNSEEDVEMTSPLGAATRTPVQEDNAWSNSPSPIRRRFDVHRGTSARVDSFPLHKLDSTSCSTIRVLADSAQSGLRGTIIAANNVLFANGGLQASEVGATATLVPKDGQEETINVERNNCSWHALHKNLQDKM